MTVPVGAEDASEERPAAPHAAPHDPGSRPRPAPTAREAVDAICPYLTSDGGAWRLLTPSRDHRCVAVDPPVPQSNDKQRRHCLSEDHVACPLFVAAREARTATLAAGSDPAFVTSADRRRRPLARTAPILLEPPRLVDQAVRLQLDRGLGQVALIALMIVAFAIVALTRLSSGAVPGTSPSPRASATAVVRTPAPRPSPTAAVSAKPSVAPSTPVASGPPTAARTYRVKKGDTLVSIAGTFGTTAAKIKTLNGLTTSTLKIGQILKIP